MVAFHVLSHVEVQDAEQCDLSSGGRETCQLQMVHMGWSLEQGISVCLYTIGVQSWKEEETITVRQLQLESAQNVHKELKDVKLKNMPEVVFSAKLALRRF